MPVEVYVFHEFLKPAELELAIASIGYPIVLDIAKAPISGSIDCFKHNIKIFYSTPEEKIYAGYLLYELDKRHIAYLVAEERPPIYAKDGKLIPQKPDRFILELYHQLLP